MSLEELQAQPSADALRILVVHGDVPSRDRDRDRDPGSLRLFTLLELLVEDGHKVTLVGVAGPGQEQAVAELVALGVDVFPIDTEGLRARGVSVDDPGLDFPHLLAHGRFDIALLSYSDIAERYLRMLRAASPLTRVLIDTVDLHRVRERPRAEAMYRQADALVAVSDEDPAALRQLIKSQVRTPFVLPLGSSEVARTIAAYINTFSEGDPVSLVLPVSDDSPSAAQAVFDDVVATLAEHGTHHEQVADIQIVPTAGELVLPSRAVSVALDGKGRHIGLRAEPSEWRELAQVRRAERRRRQAPRAAILLHAINDPAVVRAQIKALEQAGLPEDIELIVAADAPGPPVECLLSALGGVRVIRGTAPLGRHQAWQLAAYASSAPLVVALAPLAIPARGFVEPLLESVRQGAVLAAPVVAGAAGLLVGPDGSLWPGDVSDAASPDALPLDCIASTRELVAEGLPVFPRADGFLEAQLAAWARQRGPIEVTPQARVDRIAPPEVTVVVCTRDRSSDIFECVTLLLGTEARDIVIVDNGSTDDTAEVVAELSRRSGGIVRHVPERRLGASHARNAGAAAAHNDLLLYIDDDARPAPGWLNHLACALARPGVVHASGPIAALWPGHRPAGWPGPDQEGLLAIFDRGEAERTLPPPLAPYGPSWAVRREALHAVGGFDPDFGPAPDSRVNGEETLVSYRVYQQGLGTTVYSPGAAVGHRVQSHRIDDREMLKRALCSGIEGPRIRHRIGEADVEELIWRAGACANRLLAAIPMSGELSVGEAFERITSAPADLTYLAPLALALGDLAASTVLLGERLVIAGEFRLRIDDPESLLKGFLASPAREVPVA